MEKSRQDQPLNRNKKRAQRIFIGMMVIGLTGFILLTWQVAAHGEVPFDDPIREAFYDLRQPGLTTLAEAITHLGSWQAMVILCILLLVQKRTRAYGIPIAVAAVLTTIVRGLVKEIIQRPRPEEVWHLVEEGGYSFPSGHAITSLAVYGLCFLFLLQEYRRSRKEKESRRTGSLILVLICAFLSLAIGLSRIYLGVHFPSDVLAGWCFALAAVGIVLLAEDWLQERLIKIGSSAKDG